MLGDDEDAVDKDLTQSLRRHFTEQEQGIKIGFRAVHPIEEKKKAVS